MESGKKEVFNDHFIIPNGLDARQIKDLTMEWLKRLHHSPAVAEKEFFITEVNGISIPYWVVSLEAQTAWKGLVKRSMKRQLEIGRPSPYIPESGHFRRNYRWAVSSRENICEYWGFVNPHEPNEKVPVSWDGFPLDSTFSRGRINENMGMKKNVQDRVEDLSAYDVREFFDYKFSNGLPVLSIQVGEEEAFRRAKAHVELYHHKLAEVNIDILIEARTELEVAGIQLIHLPFWHVKYVYKTTSMLKHFSKSRERNVLMEGYAGGILKGELALLRKDKLWLNGLICGVASVLFLVLGVLWHPSLLFVAVFTLCVCIASLYSATVKKTNSLKPVENGTNLLPQQS